MSPIFYQKYWHVVGPSVTAAVLQALNSCVFPSSLNHTFTNHIPKKKNVVRVSDFQSISLCNVIYKLIAKVLLNRLKMVLTNVINESQSAFATRRLISDNILIAYELVHFLKHKRKRKWLYVVNTRYE